MVAGVDRGGIALVFCRRRLLLAGCRVLGRQPFRAPFGCVACLVLGARAMRYVALCVQCHTSSCPRRQVHTLQHMHARAARVCCLGLGIWIVTCGPLHARYPARTAAWCALPSAATTCPCCVRVRPGSLVCLCVCGSTAGGFATPLRCCASRRRLRRSRAAPLFTCLVHHSCEPLPPLCRCFLTARPFVKTPSNCIPALRLHCPRLLLRPLGAGGGRWRLSVHCPVAHT